ncbi:hypothetical protein JCM13210_04970 [Thermaerobacter litoralis]
MGTGEWEMLSQEEIDALLRSLAEEGAGGGLPAASGQDPPAGRPDGEPGPEGAGQGDGGSGGGSARPSGGGPRAGGREGERDPAGGAGDAPDPATGAGAAGASVPGGASLGRSPAGGRSGPQAGGMAGGMAGGEAVPAAAAAEPALSRIPVGPGGPGGPGAPGGGPNPAGGVEAGFFPLHGGPEAADPWAADAGDREGAAALARGTLDLLLDVPLQLTVELGQTQRTVRELLEMAPGTVLELDRLAGEPVDLLVNGRLIARGEVVVIDENFGIRITDIVSPGERLRRLR